MLFLRSAKCSQDAALIFPKPGWLKAEPAGQGVSPGKQVSSRALTPTEVWGRGNLYSSYEQGAPVRGVT